MIRISSSLAVEDRELAFEFIRASGPGGQNVNKVATAVQLRFDVLGSPSLPPAVKLRLRRVAGRRMTEAGILIIEARRHRTQEQNRAEALERFRELVLKAAVKPVVRRSTRPTAASKERRLQFKKRKSEVKRGRSKLETDT